MKVGCHGFSIELLYLINADHKGIFFNFPLKEKGMGEKKTYLFADFLELEIGHFGGCDSLSAFHLIFASYQVVI